MRSIRTGVDDLEGGHGDPRRRRALEIGLKPPSIRPAFFKSLGARVPHEMFEEQKRLADALGGSAVK
jgi:hypothetical protein